MDHSQKVSMKKMREIFGREIAKLRQTDSNNPRKFDPTQNTFQIFFKWSENMHDIVFDSIPARRRVVYRNIRGTFTIVPIDPTDRDTEINGRQDRHTQYSYLS